MPEVEDLMPKLLSSEIKAEILILYHMNPGLIDTPEALARRIGRGQVEVTKDLEDLLILGILRKKPLGSNEVVFLDRDRDRDIQKLLKAHIESLGD